jgi:AcrR family transcriptional regulator
MLFSEMERKRKYELKRRAERLEETRRRIVEATLELHSTVGGRRTTISEIARRAGVQRVTVYNHFPDERSLWKECISLGLTKQPFPDPEGWAAIRNWRRRLTTALRELYGYYRLNESLLAHAFADAESAPLIRELFATPYRDYLDAVTRLLLEGAAVRDGRRARLSALLGIALEFHTWRFLARVRGLGDDEAARLMASTIDEHESASSRTKTA